MIFLKKQFCLIIVKGENLIAFELPGSGYLFRADACISYLIYFRDTLQRRAGKDEIKKLKACSQEYEAMLHEYKNQVDAGSI